MRNLVQRESRVRGARPPAGRRTWAAVTALVLAMIVLALASPSLAQTAKRPRPAPVHKQTSKRLLPKVHAGIVNLRINGKSSTYHRTTQARPAEFVVQGPARLEVGARLLLPADKSGSPVRLRLELDGKLEKTLRAKAAASKSASLVGAPGRVGTRAHTVLMIPAGPHKLRIVPIRASAIAALRVTVGAPAHGKTKWVRFEPQVYERPLILRSGDREETWYRFTTQKPAGLDVRGPLSLKISTRLDFDQNSGPSQAYVVKVLVDGVEHGYSLKSRASQVAVYPEMPEIVPGSAGTFDIKLKSGPHKIVLRLDGTTATGATIRIRVPERELKAGNRS